jgi:hypothetical protein
MLDRLERGGDEPLSTESVNEVRGASGPRRHSWIPHRTAHMMLQCRPVYFNAHTGNQRCNVMYFNSPRREQPPLYTLTSAE